MSAQQTQGECGAQFEELSVSGRKGGNGQEWRRPNGLYLQSMGSGPGCMGTLGAGLRLSPWSSSLSRTRRSRVRLQWQFVVLRFLGSVVICFPGPQSLL